MQEAQRRVEAATKPVTFTAPGPAFDASGASGKTVYFIANGLQVPFNALVLKGTEDALKLAGVKTIALDSKGQISETVRLIQQGIAQHVDLMVLPSIPSNRLTAPLRDVKAAGISVIERFASDPRLPTAAEKALGVFGIVSYCFKCGGKLMADYAISDSQGAAHAISYWDSDVGTAEPEIDGMREEFSELCSSCDITFKDVPVSKWATAIPPLTQTDLVAKQANYFLPIYDGMIEFMLPAIAAANAEDRVRIVSLNADSAPMHELANGSAVVADIGTPIEWAGWAIADQALRALTGQPAVADEKIPFRLFDKANLPDLSKPEATWYGADFKAGYEGLWEVGGG